MHAKLSLHGGPAARRPGGAAARRPGGQVAAARQESERNILLELEALAPVTAVLGNNDFDEYGERVGRFAHPVIDGVRFLVAHYPRDVKITFAGSAALAPGDPIPQVCVHGHTHVPELVSGPDARPATLVLCPGAVFRSRGDFPRSIAKVEVEDGRVLSARIESLTGSTVMGWGQQPS